MGVKMEVAILSVSMYECMYVCVYIWISFFIFAIFVWRLDLKQFLLEGVYLMAFG